VNEDNSLSNAGDLLTANLATIERNVAFACRRYRFKPDDAEEFASVVKLRLIENDYAVLRKFEGRSSFSTFISSVVQRMALDYQIHMWGKWHPSAEAMRLGEMAVELERCLRRDGRSIEEVLPSLRQRYGDVDRDTLDSIVARLPQRGPRRRSVALEEAEDVAAACSAEETAFAEDRQRTSAHISEVMNDLLQKLPPDDQVILQLRFEGNMSVADIARALLLDQKLLYRRIERCIRGIRDGLTRAGVDANEALDLIGHPGVALDFIMRNQATRPSKHSDGSVAAKTEVSQ